MKEMITKEQATAIVREWINRPDPYWPDRPEMVITVIEDREYGWIFYYTSRPYWETKDIRHAIAGNGPLIVSQEDASIFPAGTAAPIKDRIVEAEAKMHDHLRQTRKPNQAVHAIGASAPQHDG
jgi:hypothetical protein